MQDGQTNDQGKIVLLSLWTVGHWRQSFIILWVDDYNNVDDGGNDEDGSDDDGDDDKENGDCRRWCGVAIRDWPRFPPL